MDVVLSNQSRIHFEGPKKYQSKIRNLKEKFYKYNPLDFVDKTCRLKGLAKVWVIHKPLKLSAEFKIPSKIFLDFSNSVNYIALSIAHEYSHLLLRKHTHLDYSLEQTLAILLQLTYENQVDIREFKKENAQELMKIMNVWPQGKNLLQKWPSYIKDSKKGNILTWLEK